MNKPQTPKPTGPEWETKELRRAYNLLKRSTTVVEIAGKSDGKRLVVRILRRVLENRATERPG